MKLTFVNVGYGEAMLIECPDPCCEDGTFVMIIDGGGADEEEFRENTSGRIPFAEYLHTRGIRHIDLMVNTHIHEDHLSGLLPVVRDIVPSAYWQGLDANGLQLRHLNMEVAETMSQKKFLTALNDWHEMLELLEAGDCKVKPLKAGDSGELCDGLRFTVLAPSADRCARLRDHLQALYAEEDPEEFSGKLTALDARMNNYSLMLMLDYRGTRILLPGDTNSQGFADICPEDLRTDIYKVGHHGQQDGVDHALLEMMQPKAVVCCASSDRRYNSAEPETMAMIADTGAQLWFSDCPPVRDTPIPPHRALVFSVEEDGKFAAKYVLE